MPSSSTAWLLVASALAYGLFSYVQGLRSNIAAARASGLPYVVAPISPFNLWWQLPHKLLAPLIKLLLPKAWWEPWLDVLQPDWSYRLLREPWEQRGDTFLIVSPGHMLLSTRDAHAIHQITSRREAFPKQTAYYELLAIFGRNLLCSEGAEWKMHRKGISSSFNEKNAAFIFGESTRQTQGMVAYWMAGQDAGENTDSPTIDTLEHDTMTLALNIITHVGFGLRLLWPGQSMPDDVDARTRLYGALEPPAGHSMTFAASLALVLENMLIHLLLPPRILRLMPFKTTKTAYEARWNYEKYMEELLRDKIADAQSPAGEKEPPGMDIMGQMVRAKYTKQDQKTTGEGPQLSDSDIIGNSFIVLVAGHETTANTLHFALIQLATNPSAQRALQADVDRIFGRHSDPLTWEYDKNINALMASNVATSMNEVLRLTPSVVDIPKVVGGNGQSLVLEGKRHFLPAGTSIVLNSIGAQRNPRYWSSKPGKDGAPDDLDDFVPERWYRPSSNSKAEAASEEEEEDFGGFKGPDTSAQLYRPVPGSFIAFSEGARSCIGRRIAQVEIVAALAVLFQQYSVELEVGAWASDDEVSKMGPDERRALYEKARKASNETVRKATTLLTLKLHGELKVPIRLVKRGSERFVALVDQDA